MADNATSRVLAQRFRAALRLSLGARESVLPDGGYWLLRASIPVAVRYSRVYLRGSRASWWYGITSADAERLADRGELALIMPAPDRNQFLLLDALRTSQLLSRCGQDSEGTKKIHITMDFSGNEVRLQEWPELDVRSLVRAFTFDVLANAGLDVRTEDDDLDGPRARPGASTKAGSRALWRPRAFDPSREPIRVRSLEFSCDLQETLVLREKANADHHRLVAALHELLGTRSWTKIEEIPCAIDLWAVRPRDGRRVIFECKTLRAGGAPAELHQCRLGLAQLLEYRFLYGTSVDELCLVTSGPVSEQRVVFLESMGLGVLWIDEHDARPLGMRCAAMIADFQ